MMSLQYSLDVFTLSLECCHSIIAMSLSNSCNIVKILLQYRLCHYEIVIVLLFFPLLSHVHLILFLYESKRYLVRRKKLDSYFPLVEDYLRRGGREMAGLDVKIHQ